MRKIILLCGFLLLLVAFVFAGCHQEPAEPLSLTLLSDTAVCEMGKKFDLTKLHIIEEDVNYSYSASYLDPATGQTVEIAISESGKIQQDFPADVHIAISASRGEETVTETADIAVTYEADAVDRLLTSGGKAGYADPGVCKWLSFDPAFFRQEGGTSSIKVSMEQGKEPAGKTVLDLCHYSLTPYYTARIWNDALVTFWVYNPDEKPIEFRLNIFDANAKINIGWNSEANDQVQWAQPGQWTQLFFSLKKYGVDGILYMDEDLTRNDILEVQAKATEDRSCEFYVDGVDIIPAYKVSDLFPEAELPAQPLDMLAECKMHISSLGKHGSYEVTSKGTNKSEDTFRFWTAEKTGYPMLKLSFTSATDITEYDFLRLDVKAVSASPWLGVYLEYADASGKTQTSAYYADFRTDVWKSVNIPLSQFQDADLTKVKSIKFCVNFDDGFVADKLNEVYLDNVFLTALEASVPMNTPAIQEDDDLISGPFQWSGTGGIKEDRNGIIKVSEDGNGNCRSNSALMFWANTTSGYPRASFFFDEPQDWSRVTEMYVDTRMENAYGWVSIELITYDEAGMIQYIQYSFDAINSAWNTHVIPIQWFDRAELPLIYGIRLTCNLDGNFVSGTVSKVYIDNLYILEE